VSSSNASIIPVGSGRGDVDELRVPIMELAKEAGNAKAANIVALALSSPAAGS